MALMRCAKKDACGGVKKSEKERKKSERADKREKISKNSFFVFFSSDIRVFLFFLVALSLSSLSDKALLKEQTPQKGREEEEEVNETLFRRSRFSQQRRDL
jgi:heme/copper-type cytochrome/quinol oxidase subunit 3